jgi:iron(III) transport system substrate-binding protein
MLAAWDHMRRVALAAFSAFALIGAAAAQSPQSAIPGWADPALLKAAQAEGSVTVYSSVNEQEGLPLWQVFEKATGIKVNYVRSSDNGLLSRILLEGRAGQKSWDVVMTTAVSKLPDALLEPFELKEAAGLRPEAISKTKRWYAVYSNYNSPAINTRTLKIADMPATYEAMAKRADLAGKVAFEPTDSQWVYAMFQLYGEARARTIIGDLMTNLKPVPVDGHLALARAIGLGEYQMAINNFTNLTINVGMSGNPTDYWVMDPVALFYGQLGISSGAPHPKAAQLAADFVISKEGQIQISSQGRIPVRRDVPTNPPGVIDRLEKGKVIPVVFSPEDEKKWQQITKQLLNVR